MKGKTERHSFAASMSAAFVAFFVVALPMHFLFVVPVATEFGGGLSSSAGASPAGFALHVVMIVVMFGLQLYIASLVSMATYYAMRWKNIPDIERHCVNCGYDLTGNLSGVCSECGEAVEVTE